MTTSRLSSASVTMLPCRFCRKQPGEKVGPPALVRCIEPGCPGSALGAVLRTEWNAIQQPAPASGASASVQTLTDKDFYDMSGPDLLAYCGADARKWAEAFCRTKETQGWGAMDIDEGLMVTWFANAIEHSEQVRAVAQSAPPEPVAWRYRHGTHPWIYAEQKPTGPAAHLFERQPLFTMSSTQRDGDEK